MKKEIKKSRLEIRLDKQGEKLRENLKKRAAWQRARDEQLAALNQTNSSAEEEENDTED